MATVVWAKVHVCATAKNLKVYFTQAGHLNLYYVQKCCSAF